MVFKEENVTYNPRERKKTKRKIIRALMVQDPGQAFYKKSNESLMSHDYNQTYFSDKI